MEEIEIPIEKLQEDIHHEIEHGHDSTGFMMKGALLSAVLAVFAAICALMAGHYSNEALIEQLSASNAWAYYQAKGIKSSITEIKLMVSPKDAEPLKEKMAEYKQQQEEIKKEAEEKQEESRHHLSKHQALASAVTFFQIAIALTAISVLTRKRRFMGGSLVLGIIGALMMARGLWLI